MRGGIVAFLLFILQVTIISSMGGLFSGVPLCVKNGRNSRHAHDSSKSKDSLRHIAICTLRNKQKTQMSTGGLTIKNVQDRWKLGCRQQEGCTWTWGCWCHTAILQNQEEVAVVKVKSTLKRRAASYVREPLVDLLRPSAEDQPVDFLAWGQRILLWIYRTLAQNWFSSLYRGNNFLCLDTENPPLDLLRQSGELIFSI